MQNIFSVNSKKNGISLYWNDETLVVEPYDKINKVYHCGNELQTHNDNKRILYTILVLDLSECYCANVYSDGEIVKLFSDTSLVPKKHKKGGQSAPRFGRIRENAITKWFKDVNMLLSEINEDIILGMSPIYYQRFWAHLSTYNKEKVLDHRNSAYSDISGVYDLLNDLRRNG